MSVDKKFLFLLSLYLFVAFVFFSYLVYKDVFYNFDYNSTLWLQHKISSSWDSASSLLSLIGSFEISGIVWLALAIIFRKSRQTLTGMFLFFVGMGLEFLGKVFLYHPSPPSFLYRGKGLLFPLHYVHTNYSYPSGHAFRTSFLVMLVLLYILANFKKTKRNLLVIGLAIFLIVMLASRIYLGEHWTTDVIGGTLLGVALGILPAVTFIKHK